MKKAKKVSFYQYVPLLFLLLTSWQVSAKINVIASFSIIGDMAKNIGQDRITLRTIVGPNGDAHVYEPSPADALF